MTENQEPEVLLPQEAVVGVVRLLGEIAGMECPVSERRRALMERMSELLEADGWLWTSTRVDQAERRPYSVGLIHGGLTDEQIIGISEASETALQPPPEDGPLSVLVREGDHFTRTRQQVVSDEVWYSHPNTRQYRLNRGLDHFLYSIYPLSPEHCSAIGFFRRIGGEPFTDLQRRLCHIVFSNVRWLHEASFPEHEGRACATLTPRLRTVLVCLLDGRQKDEIARMLHISTNTVKTHIRSIYRHFGVSSQIELMHHFQAGNGGDVEVS